MKNIKVTDKKIKHVLSLADAPLVLGQRLGEWCGHGPVLEQDIALTNIALDLVGQARLFYQYAADLSEAEQTEDDYAYWRLSDQFLNILLVEIENGDFAQTILKQLFFSTYTEILYRYLSESTDERIAGIAIKSLKEVKYHKRYSTEWTLRLGGGTEESHRRMITAIDALWRYTPELWSPEDYEINSGILPEFFSFEDVKAEWVLYVKNTFKEAGLMIPEEVVPLKGGKRGLHTEKLSYLLAEMQNIPRAYPTATW